MIQCSVRGWVERLKLDTADTSSVNGGDLNVSLVSPRGSPGVSDDVVVLSALGSVSNGGNGVIELGSASGGVQNTGGVVLEDSLVGLDGDRNWLLVDGSLELRDGSGWDVGVVLNLNLSLG